MEDNKGQAEALAKAALAKRREEAAQAIGTPVGAVRNIEPPKAPTRLYKAIHKAQANFETVRKNGKNPHFNSKYATIDEIWETEKKAINDAGLIVFCTTRKADGERLLVTHLVEIESGEEITCELPLAAANTPQAIGSAMTYLRRYTLTALLEIVTGDGIDDDGETATPANRQTRNPSAKAAASALGF